MHVMMALCMLVDRFAAWSTIRVSPTTWCRSDDRSAY